MGNSREVWTRGTSEYIPKEFREALRDEPDQFRGIYGGVNVKGKSTDEERFPMIIDFDHIPWIIENDHYERRRILMNEFENRDRISPHLVQMPD